MKTRPADRRLSALPADTTLLKAVPENFGAVRERLLLARNLQKVAAVLEERLPEGGQVRAEPRLVIGSHFEAVVAKQQMAFDPEKRMNGPHAERGASISVTDHRRSKVPGSGFSLSVEVLGGGYGGLNLKLVESEHFKSLGELNSWLGQNTDALKARLDQGLAAAVERAKRSTTAKSVWQDVVPYSLQYRES